MRKSILITGGSRGIGRAAALRLAKEEEPSDIVITYREREKEAKEVVEKIKSMGHNAMTFKCDVSKHKDVEELFGEINNSIKSPDILINNAGIDCVSLFQDTDEKTWKEIFDVNVTGVYNTISLALPTMLKNHKGYILNISSMWGITGGAMEVAYSASKGAVNALTKALAKEVGPSGIIVNAIAPGAVRTEMCEHLGEETLKYLVEEIPAGRLMEPEEIAELIAFLVTGKCDYIQGQIISPNGGLVV